MCLKTIRIHARHSDLARLQAYRVGDALKEKNPELQIEYSFRASLGDINLNDPLWKMPEKGVFTEDFVRDLTEGSADLVVHSWKDLPTLARPETEIVATLPRADVRDVLLFRRDRLTAKKKGDAVHILTSSPRRSYNLEAFLKTHLPFQPSAVQFEPVRGNIPTRLRKMMSQDVDGLIVAKAALDRLLEAPEEEFREVQQVIRQILESTRFMVLPLSVNPTAAAQGALAIEIRKDREDLREILRGMNCVETFRAVQKERDILSSYGGGCHQKIGVNILPRPYGEITVLRGLTDSGITLDKFSLSSSVASTSANSPIEIPKPTSSEAMFPRAGEEARFFTREKLARATWAWAEKERCLWVARESAWPEDFHARPDAIVWTAGLETWKKLAERGVWISGSSEGLGESENTRLQTLVPELANDDSGWVKLTHDGGAAQMAATKKVCSTYRLLPSTHAPDLSGRTHFFWMSGSAFERALVLHPEIRSAHHASGPGHTHEHLVRLLGSSASIRTYLNIHDWRESLGSVVSAHR